MAVSNRKQNMGCPHKITGTQLQSISDISEVPAQCRKRILKDKTHPSQSVYLATIWGEIQRHISCCMTRLQSSFNPQASLLNSSTKLR